MDQNGLLLYERILLFLLAATVAVFRTSAQQVPEALSHPPTSFSAEDDKFPGAVPLPDCVRRSLAGDNRVVNTLQYENLSPDQLPEEWFTAFEINPDSRKGKLFIVMGASLMRGANINPFWVFQQLPKTCQLLLHVGAHDLEVLSSETKGLPNIKIASATAVRFGESEFKFDGRGYQEVSRNSQPIGEEIPRNPSDFQTRKPLVQGPAQDPEPILSEARGWLWKQWCLERPSYLRVILHSKEGDKTTTTYYIRKIAGRLDVLIDVRSVLADRVGRADVQHSLIEEEILVATDVERRQALKGNPDRTTVVPESQEVASDFFELYFLDDAGNTVVIL